MELTVVLVVVLTCFRKTSTRFPRDSLLFNTFVVITAATSASFTADEHGGLLTATG